MLKADVLALTVFVFCSQQLCGQNLDSPPAAECREQLPATIFSWDGERAALGPLSSITTDRPDFTEASSTVGLGVAQLETGYTYTRSAGTDSHSWGEPLFRLGTFANWFELRAAVSPVSVVSNGTDSGTEDLYLGTKLWLAQQDGWRPELAVVTQMTVPTGSPAFSADRVLPGVNLLYGWDLSDNLSFAGSTQYNRAVDEIDASYNEWAQSATLGRSLTEKVGAYTEWFAFFPAGSAVALPEHYINGGFTYLFNDDIQFDIRIGKGLNDASDDFFAGAGLSFRFGNKGAEPNDDENDEGEENQQ
jgi:hypothetical protein